MFLKKIKLDNNYFKASLWAFIVIAFLILFEKLLGNIDFVFEKISMSISFLFGILEPFIFGFFIAYFLDPITNWLETKILSRANNFNRRLLSVILTYVIFIGLLIWSLIYLIPELVYNIQKLIIKLPDGIKKINNIRYGFLYKILDKCNQMFKTNYDLEDIIKKVLDVASKPFIKTNLSISNMANGIISKTFGFASSLLNFVLGVVIAFYILCDKNKLVTSIEKIIYIISGPAKSKKIILSVREYNSVFKKFIIGKSVDSVIIGVLFFIICSFIRLPYVLFLSLIIGVTNMIPYFGPFIGALPVIFIALLYKPILAIWVSIIIFVLQQFDGIILGPKILGDSTGLKPIEVIFSIVIG